jgi:hypothetical protein
VTRQRRDVVSATGQQRSDAEIEQLHLALLGHEDVRRLEIAMDDEIAVSVRNGREHVEEQTDALLDAETALVAILIDAFAAHVFQNEVRLATGFDTGIQQTGDVRMLQAGEHSPFTRKALLRWMPDERGIEELHRDLPFEPTIAAMCQPDCAHAAEAERPLQRVRPYGMALETGRKMGTQRRFEELAVRKVGDAHQAGSDVRSQLRCTRFEILEPCLARAARQIERLVEQRADLAPKIFEPPHAAYCATTS